MGRGNWKPGECIHCTQPAVPGRACCREHLAADARRSMKRLQAKRKAGLCLYPSCGAPPEPGRSPNGRPHAYCRTHIGYHNRAQKRYRARAAQAAAP
jgi:hypothetical protein